MFSFNRSTVAAIGAAAVFALEIFGTSPGALAAIPLVAAPHAGTTTGTTTTGARPNIVIRGSCGTAFLYPSNVWNHIHYDFGFEYLNKGPFYLNAHVGSTNVDNGKADVNSFSGALFSSSWEKQGSLHTAIGENEVSAYIYGFGFLHDCASSPNLHQAVYVYWPLISRV